jgi:predicted ATPase
MIDHLRIQNFKCLRDVSIDLGPLTVFVGPNDSGKTSILEAIYLLGQTTIRQTCQRGPDEHAVFNLKNDVQGNKSLANLVWRGDLRLQPKWEVQANIAGQFANYSLAVPIRGTPFVERLDIAGRLDIDVKLPPEEIMRRNEVTWTKGFEDRQNQRDSPAVQFGRLLQSSPVYRFEPIALRRFSPPLPNPTLSPQGDNLAAVLDALVTGPDRRAREEMENHLRDAVGNLTGFALRTQPMSPGSIVLKAIEFVLAGSSPPVTIPAALASDGAMLLLAYLALAYSETPDILLIEEPENGLHPLRLKMVLDLLRKISRGEVGNRKRQVILTTQSPILLNYAEPEEVRIVRRNDEGATEVTPFNKAPGVRELLEEFAIGELWFLLGEEGLLKGERP